MGKYMRKPKLSGDVVAVMDVSQSSLGVRTRAKTLALQKLQASNTTSTPAPSEQNPGMSYLQLRSRRLEKPPLQKSICCGQQNPNPNRACSRSAISPGVSSSAGSGSLIGKTRVLGEPQIKADVKTEVSCDLGSEEASFGENDFDFDGRERSTRESTPCSLMRGSNAINTPGSSTRPRNLNRITIERSMPSADEIEAFFAHDQQEQQRRFTEKYNFDIANEKPLQGRYEWVKVQTE